MSLCPVEKFGRLMVVILVHDRVRQSQEEQDCRRQEHLKFFCKRSFLEIYNEQITDLLQPSSTNLQMREDAKKGVYVENLSEVKYLMIFLRDVLLEELSGLRGQLLDILDTKLGEEQAISKLSTPQKRALALELSTLERENELLLIEVKSYQDELKECRNNLNSCLVANADLARQVDKLQATVKQLQSESNEVPNIFSGTSANHALPQETAPSPDANILLEARELALQERHALINVEEQVTELKKQLIEAQNLIQKLSSEVAEAKVIPEADDLSETDPSDRSKRKV